MCFCKSQCYAIPGIILYKCIPTGSVFIFNIGDNCTFNNLPGGNLLPSLQKTLSYLCNGNNIGIVLLSTSVVLHHHLINTANVKLFFAAKLCHYCHNTP